MVHQLGLPEDRREYSLVSDTHLLDGIKVNKGEPLFPRLDAEAEEKAIAEMMAGPKEAVAA